MFIKSNVSRSKICILVLYQGRANVRRDASVHLVHKSVYRMDMKEQSHKVPKHLQQQSKLTTLVKYVFLSFHNRQSIEKYESIWNLFQLKTLRSREVSQTLREPNKSPKSMFYQILTIIQIFLFSLVCYRNLKISCLNFQNSYNLCFAIGTRISKKDFWRILRNIQAWFLAFFQGYPSMVFVGFLGISRHGFGGIFSDIQAWFLEDLIGNIFSVFEII